MDQVIQVLGSLLILAAFAAAQRGALSTTSRTYLSLNLVGSLVLGVLAAHERQLGFLLLETCWAAVSAWSLYRSSPQAVTVSDREPPESRCSQR
jgi:hypothetical protein